MSAVRLRKFLSHGPWLLVCLQLGVAEIALAGESNNMEEEIDYLIAEVADSDCEFIRNGKAHGAKEAGEHLQMKRQRGKRYYETTEQFIDRIASKSSWSGKDYRIGCGGGTPITANAWFLAKLSAFRASASDGCAHSGLAGGCDEND